MKKTIVIASINVMLSIVGCAGATASVAASTQQVTTQLSVMPTVTLPVVNATAVVCKHTTAIIIIPLTAAKHSQIIAHAKLAILTFHYPRIMVLNRVGAAARRTALLKAIPIRRGFDRDEYLPAAGRSTVRAHVAYVNPTQNRSAGAVMGNKLRPYCNGTKFRYNGT